MTATLEASMVLPLIDHHCHGLVKGDLDRDSYDSRHRVGLGTAFRADDLRLAVRGHRPGRMRP